MLKVNQYFQGKVKSIAFEGEAQPCTVGVIQPGEYEFSTTEKETMTVVSGMMNVTLPDSEFPKSFHAGSVFTIEAGKTFTVSVDADAAYLCSYG